MNKILKNTFEKAKNLIESFLASVVVLAIGWITIPIVGKLSDVTITSQQGFVMGAYFFVGRWIIYYLVRTFFYNKSK